LLSSAPFPLASQAGWRRTCCRSFNSFISTPLHFSSSRSRLLSWLLPQVWLLALEPDAATGLPPAPLEAEFPAPIRWMRLGAACLLLLGEGGRVFVRLGAPGQAAGDVVELRRVGGVRQFTPNQTGGRGKCGVQRW
jgi:hypothetical protein